MSLSQIESQSHRKCFKFENQKIASNRVNLEEKMVLKSDLACARLVCTLSIVAAFSHFACMCARICVRACARVCVARKRLRPAGLLLQ